MANMPSNRNPESGREFGQILQIETTYMRYGHWDGGITGITLNDECVKTWAYGIHICSTILQDLNEMGDVDPAPSQLNYKEEGKGRLTSDGKDRLSLREKLELCIDQLDPEQHPRDGLVNIVTGEVVYHPSVNADQASGIGGSSSVKSLRQDGKVFDTGVLYTRAMGLQSSQWEMHPPLTIC